MHSIFIKDKARARKGPGYVKVHIFKENKNFCPYKEMEFNFLFIKTKA